MAGTLQQVPCYDARMIRHAFSLGASIALALVLAGCPSKATCPAATSATGPAAEATITDVLRTVEQWRQAWEVRSPDALFPLYDHGKAVAAVTQGTALVGWDAVQADLAARIARATDVRYRLTDIQVAPTGDTAIVTASLAREISEGATTATDAGTLTLVFARDAARWVIVSEHFSFRPR
jgi:ketosteroid isomerase-like protein